MCLGSGPAPLILWPGLEILRFNMAASLENMFDALHGKVSRVACVIKDGSGDPTQSQQRCSEAAEDLSKITAYTVIFIVGASG